MAKTKDTLYTQFFGGIADFKRLGIAGSYASGRSVDVRSDPRTVTILPRTIKESASVVTDLVKFAETYDPNLTTYMFDESGSLYSRTSAAVYTKLRTVANSHGNGLVYSAEDGFLYYLNDSTIGKYGPLSSNSPTFVDDFLSAQGGVPLNTNALDLESSSSQYATATDSASLSITGNLAIDTQIKPESLPSAGNEMVIASKWSETGTTRSYKFAIGTLSGIFGDGSDGALTISTNTTDAPIDSACTGTIGSTTLTATNASFAAGQRILIHQTRGTSAGQWMANKITAYVAGTITLESPLNASYTVGGGDPARS